jgi:hypothetical protein
MQHFARLSAGYGKSDVLPEALPNEARDYRE